MRKIRRLLAGILCFVMVFQQAGIAKAETVHNADGIIVTDYTSESILDPLDELAVSYNDIGFKEATSIFNRNTILSFCEDDVQYAFRTPFHHYRSSILSSMLKECAWIVSIDDDGSITYVQYHMISGEEVYLSYTEDGIFDKTVYYPTLDTLVITKDNQLIRRRRWQCGF